MNATTRTATINRLASSATPVPLDDLDIPATDLAELHKDGMVQVAWTAEGNVVSLTSKGLGTIPAGKSTTPAQHAVLQAISEAESGQLPTTVLYGMEAVKVTPAVLLEMVSRGWVKAEYVDADGDTLAGISLSLAGKDGKAGYVALEYPVRASAAKMSSGGPRTSNGTVEHPAIPDSFTKTYKERAYNLTHKDGAITVAELGKTYSSLTAAAQAIQESVLGRKVSVNGWSWFGFTK